MSNYPLRISEELMEHIKVLSKYDGRSVNKEIEFILKKHIEEIKRTTPAIMFPDKNNLRKI